MLQAPLLSRPTRLTILKSDPTGNIFSGDQKVVQLDVGDEARGPGSVGRGFLLPPDAAFILYVLSAWVLRVCISI